MTISRKRAAAAAGAAKSKGSSGAKANGHGSALTRSGEVLLASSPLMMDELSRTEQESLDDILKDLKGAYTRIAAAGKKWVAMDEDLRRRVINATPAGMRDLWDRLERVGLGTLHPQLATAQGVAARYLGRLPLADQEHYLRERIPTVILADGKRDVLNIDVAAMSTEQRKQVFVAAGNAVRVRSLAEQRAYLADVEQRKTRKAEKSEMLRIDRPGRWEARDGKVFPAPEKMETGLTRRDLLEMLKDLGR